MFAELGTLILSPKLCVLARAVFSSYSVSVWEVIAISLCLLPVLKVLPYSVLLVESIYSCWKEP